MTERYRDDLLHLIVKRYYTGVLSPGEFRQKLYEKKKKEPTAQEIKDSILRRLVGD